MRYRLVIPAFTSLNAALESVAEDINLEDSDVGVYLRLWNIEANGADPQYYFNFDNPSVELQKSLKRLRQTGHIQLKGEQNGI